MHENAIHQVCVLMSRLNLKKKKKLEKGKVKPAIKVVVAFISLRG